MSFTVVARHRSKNALFDAQLVGPVPGPATIAHYRSVAANYLLPELGSKLVKDIDAQTLVDLRTKLLASPGVKSAVEKGSRKPLAARIVAKILALTGTILRHGKLLKVISDNPASDVKKPTAFKVPMYEWSVEDIARLRAWFEVYWEQLLVELDITTGLRSGELRGLTWH